jgi:Tfp pilus assembly protein PilF
MGIAMTLRHLKTYLTVVAVCLVAQNAQAKDEWVHIKSANFNLISSASERDTKQAAFKLEQFRYLFSQLFPQQQLNSPVPTTVIVFKNAKTFKPFLPVYQGKPKPVAGYFQSGHDKNFIALNLGALSEKPYEVIFHEYIHLLLSYNLRSFPLWFEEGLAEFYSNCEIDEKNVALGKHHESHIYTLRENKLIPLEALFQVDHKSPAYNEGQKKGIFYAESWAFIHYLILGKYPEGQAQLNQFIARLAAGTEHRDAFNQIFSKDFKAIQKELEKYVGGRSFKYVTLKLKKNIDVDKDFSMTPLSPAAVSYYMGDLLLHGNRFDEAKTYFQQALQADPKFAPAYESLGIGYLWQDNFAEAKKNLKVAVERDSQNYLAHYYYARTIMNEISAQGKRIDSIPEEVAAPLVAALKKTIQLAPNHADAYDLLAFIYAVQGANLDDGIELLKKAIALNPSRHQFGLTLAQLYLRKQDFAQAKEILSKTARMTQEERLRAQCEQLLGTVEELLSYQTRARRARPEPNPDIKPPDIPTVAAEKPATAEPSEPPPKAGASGVTVGKKMAERVAQETISVSGTLLSMDCPTSGGLNFTVKTSSRKLTLHAASPESILLFQKGKIVKKDFYCGPLNIEVIARYIPGKEGRPKSAIDGQLISITFLAEVER